MANQMTMLAFGLFVVGLLMWVVITALWSVEDSDSDVIVGIKTWTPVVLMVAGGLISCVDLCKSNQTKHATPEPVQGSNEVGLMDTAQNEPEIIPGTPAVYTEPTASDATVAYGQQQQQTFSGR